MRELFAARNFRDGKSFQVLAFAERDSVPVFLRRIIFLLAILWPRLSHDPIVQKTKQRIASVDSVRVRNRTAARIDAHEVTF